MPKTWKALSTQITSLPLPKDKPYQGVNVLHSLFKRTGKHTYTRVATTSYPAHIACRVFRTHVAKDSTIYCIRPIRIEMNQAQ